MKNRRKKISEFRVVAVEEEKSISGRYCESWINQSSEQIGHEVSKVRGPSNWVTRDAIDCCGQHGGKAWEGKWEVWSRACQFEMPFRHLCRTSSGQLSPYVRTSGQDWGHIYQCGHDQQHSRWSIHSCHIWATLGWSSLFLTRLCQSAIFEVRASYTIFRAQCKK